MASSVGAPPTSLRQGRGAGQGSAGEASGPIGAPRGHFALTVHTSCRPPSPPLGYATAPPVRADGAVARRRSGRDAQAMSKVSGSGPRRLPHVQPGEGGQIRVVQHEVEDVDVLGDARGGDGLRDDDVADLEVPAQHHLGGGPAVLGGELGDRRVLQQALALAQRRPGLGRDAVPGVEGTGLRLLELRVQLDLVDGRDDGGLAQQPLQMGGLEVGDADRPGAAVREDPLEGLVRVEVRVPPTAASGSGRGPHTPGRAWRGRRRRRAAWSRGPGRSSTAWS